MNDIYTDFSTTLNCSIFNCCGGCTLERDLDKPPTRDEIAAYFQPLPFQFFTDRLKNWRVKARLAVRGDVDHPEIGLFAKASHDVVDMPSCPLQLNNINKALKIARNKILESRVVPYDEMRFKGHLRYLQFWNEEKSDRVQLTLVATEASETILEFAQALRADPIWHSVWLNIQPDNQNRILGETFERLWGEEWLTQTFLGKEFYFHPATFTQVHLSLFEKILMSMRAKVPQGARVIDYYAGVGVIGLSLLDKCSDLHCVENNPYAEICFNKHAPGNKHLRFHTAGSEMSAELVRSADLVIVDPPRKGVDQPLLAALCGPSDVKEILYLSCHFPSFKRDSERLKQAGWKIKSAEGYLLFPGTSHIEVLAHLVR